jgi:hypothetical protein
MAASGMAASMMELCDIVSATLGVTETVESVTTRRNKHDVDEDGDDEAGDKDDGE